jgi:hypothetical protein
MRKHLKINTLQSKVDNSLRTKEIECLTCMRESNTMAILKAGRKGPPQEMRKWQH